MFSNRKDRFQFPFAAPTESLILEFTWNRQETAPRLSKRDQHEPSPRHGEGTDEDGHPETRANLQTTGNDQTVNGISTMYSFQSYTDLFIWGSTQLRSQNFLTGFLLNQVHELHRVHNNQWGFPIVNHGPAFLLPQHFLLEVSWTLSYLHLILGTVKLSVVSTKHSTYDFTLLHWENIYRVNKTAQSIFMRNFCTDFELKFTCMIILLVADPYCFAWLKMCVIKRSLHRFIFCR
jgi:hypothetical protein